jgi:hypothetical protein
MELFKLLLAIAQWVADTLLPVHTPIVWPDFAGILAFFDVFFVLDRWVHMSVLIAVTSFIAACELGFLGYAVYRKILGLFPGLG